VIEVVVVVVVVIVIVSSSSSSFLFSLFDDEVSAEEFMEHEMKRSCVLMN